MAISFLGGGNQSTWRKPPTCHMSLTYFITKCCIEWTGFELTTLVVIGADFTGSYKLPYDHENSSPIKAVLFQQSKFIDYKGFTWYNDWQYITLSMIDSISLYLWLTVYHFIYDWQYITLSMIDSISLYLWLTVYHFIYDWQYITLSLTSQ
jgi:hypothetical protein